MSEVPVTRSGDGMDGEQLYHHGDELVVAVVADHGEAVGVLSISR